MFNASSEQIEKLAKVFAEGVSGDADEWQDFDVNEDTVVATRDKLDDFRIRLREYKKVEELDGGLFFERAQIQKGKPRVDLAIIDCGDFRLTYQQ